MEKRKRWEIGIWYFMKLEQYNIICQEASRKMSESMGTKVNINQKNKGSKGKIEIEFYSQDELDRIMNLILSCNG